jgi:hypothetical protein
MTKALDITAIVIGYLVMGSGSAVAVYWVLYFLAELIIGVENRIFIAIKIQPALVKYFRNRERINQLLREESQRDDHQ